MSAEGVRFLEGWKSAALSELTTETRPICYGVLKPGEFDPDGVPLLRIVDLADDRVELADAFRISPDLDAEFHRSRLMGGEVLLSIQGTIGRVAVAPTAAAGANISRTIAVIDVDDRATAAFVRFWLMWAGATNQFKVGGTTRNSLNIGDIRKMRCPLPTLEEQERIVEILEGHLSRLDAALANIQAVRTKAAQFRRSLLHAAFNGVLTGSAAHGKGQPAGWSLKQMSELSAKPQYGWTASATDAGTTRLLRTTDITKGPIRWSDVPFCSQTPDDLTKYLLREGDLLVSRAGSVGVSALIDQQPPEDSVFASYLIRLRAVDGVIPRYLAYFMQSPSYWEQVRDMSVGVALQNINATKLSALQVQVAPVEEQELIVGLLEGYLSQLEATLAAADRVEAQCAALRRSLLHAAFTGKLTEGWRETAGV
jgi:restriction endonuclease S subunit